jgi:hypothetical protein
VLPARPKDAHMITNPQNLQDLRQWVCWRTEERGGKQTKVPFSPLTGKRASSTDSETWTSYEEAVHARKGKQQGYHGLGFVFTPDDDLCGVDLDNCRNPKTGEIESWAQEIIEELDSYTEISPSGTGVHVLVRAKLPAGRNRKGRFEAYDRGRYFTFTGCHLSRTPQSIENRQEQLECVVRRVLGKPQSENGNRVASHPPHFSSLRRDEEVIGKARAENGGKFDRLWRGDMSDYDNDHSAADDAFVHKLWSYTQDEEQIKRIHALSGLHRSEKSGRRPDYLERSINRARENVTWFYPWPDVVQLRPHGNGRQSIHTSFVSYVPEPASWPVLADKALYGLPGDIVRSIEPHTEADPVAVLANQLVAFGNAIGHSAFLRVGSDMHYLKLNIGLVGETSKGRKGMSWGNVRELMQATDSGWTADRVLHGLSSGEGLIYAVRDRVEGENKDGERIVVDPGVEDKRLLVLEAELAGVLKVMSREGNTLSPVIRQAWDDDRLQVMTRNNPMKATGSHISLVGHITKAELLRHLTETEAANGFANRFIWLMVKRSKELPFGGEWYWVDTAPLLRRLSSALEFASAPAVITWGEDARAIWRDVYGPLSAGKPGLFGAVVSRAEAQVVRLATLYAVMDESHEIRSGHLLAALALWDYAEQSARYIFGDATGDRVADQVLEGLRSAGQAGMTRTEISNLFKRNKSADDLARVLDNLLKLDCVRWELDKDTGGRAAERWFAK